LRRREERASSTARLGRSETGTASCRARLAGIQYLALRSKWNASDAGNEEKLCSRTMSLLAFLRRARRSGNVTVKSNDGL